MIVIGSLAYASGSLNIMNIFQNIARDAPDEIFETILQSENVRIERIVSNGQSSPDNFWYDQNESEWILILQGRAALRLEEFPIADVGIFQVR